jgi:hypothetical protein
MTLSVGLAAGAWAQPPRGAAPPDRTEQEIALVGCLARMEGPGSGTAGSSASAPGGGGGFVLRSAVRSAGGSGGSSAAASTGSPTGSAGGGPTAGSEYRLVPGTTRLDLSSFLGQRVEVTGRLSAAGLAPARTESGVSSSRPSGSTGTESGAQANQTATATGNPAVTATEGATTDSNQTRPNLPAHSTLMVSAVRPVAKTCEAGQ